MPMTYEPEAAKNPPTKEDAYHEAAHAVVCLVLGQRFEYIELCHEEVTGPDGIKGVRRGRIEFDASEVVYCEGAFRAACIYTAGLCADKRMYPNETYFGLTLMFGMTDFHNATDWLDYLCFGDKSAAAKMWRKVLAETRKLVGQHWDNIARVGDELLVRERLSYDEVKGIAAIP